MIVNNVEFGRTGRNGRLRIPGLLFGSFSIQLRKPGLQSVSEIVRVASGHETVMTSTLQLQSQLAVETWLGVEGATPGTTIKLDGKYLGATGATGSFKGKNSPGAHTVEFECDGYLPKTLTQQFGSGITIISGTLAHSAQEATPVCRSAGVCE